MRVKHPPKVPARSTALQKEDGFAKDLKSSVSLLRVDVLFA